MLLFVAGFFFATVYKRFGPLGLTIVLVGLSVLLVGLVWVFSWATAWTSVFAWIMTQGALGLGLWGLLVTAAVAGVSYLVLRRATP